MAAVIPCHPRQAVHRTRTGGTFDPRPSLLRNSDPRRTSPTHTSQLGHYEKDQSDFLASSRRQHCTGRCEECLLWDLALSLATQDFPGVELPLGSACRHNCRPRSSGRALRCRYRTQTAPSAEKSCPDRSHRFGRSHLTPSDFVFLLASVPRRDSRNSHRRFGCPDAQAETHTCRCYRRKSALHSYALPALPLRFRASSCATAENSGSSCG